MRDEMNINQVVLKRSALVYWSINDMQLELKQQIMQLANSPEWQHNKTLLGLLETRANLDEAIAHLITLENGTLGGVVEFEEKLSETKTSLSKLSVQLQPQKHL